MNINRSPYKDAKNLYHVPCGLVMLQKIGCNRYSITIFFPFLSSNTPKSSLFYSSIEYAVFFTFLALVSIFFIRFFFSLEKLNPSKRLSILMAFILKLISALIIGVGFPSPQYPQAHGARGLNTPYFRSPCNGVTRACVVKGGLKINVPHFKKIFLTS